jgi:hypothetical protein
MAILIITNSYTILSRNVFLSGYHTSYSRYQISDFQLQPCGLLGLRAHSCLATPPPWFVSLQFRMNDAERDVQILTDAASGTLDITEVYLKKLKTQYQRLTNGMLDVYNILRPNGNVETE